MRADNRQIWNTSAEIFRQTYYNGQFTNEFGEMEDLGIGSTHPTGRERSIIQDHPFFVKSRAMLDRPSHKILQGTCQTKPEKKENEQMKKEWKDKCSQCGRPMNLKYPPPEHCPIICED